MGSSENWGLKAFAEAVGTEGFTLVVEPIGSTIFHQVTVSWVAFDSDNVHTGDVEVDFEDEASVASGHEGRLDRPVRTWSKTKPLGTTFDSTPRVIQGINWLEIEREQNLRL